MRWANNEAVHFQTWNGRAVSFGRSIATFPPSSFACTLGMMSFAISVILLSIVCSAHSSSIAEPLPDATTQCKISIQVTKTVEGTCVRLRGGATACQTAEYLEPFSKDCMGY